MTIFIMAEFLLWSASIFFMTEAKDVSRPEKMFTSQTMISTSFSAYDSVSMQSVSFCPSVTHAPAIAVMAEIVPIISAIKLKREYR